MDSVIACGAEMKMIAITEYPDELGRILRYALRETCVRSTSQPVPQQLRSVRFAVALRDKVSKYQLWEHLFF